MRWDIIEKFNLEKAATLGNYLSAWIDKEGKRWVLQ